MSAWYFVFGTVLGFLFIIVILVLCAIMNDIADENRCIEPSRLTDVNE